jgi:hypothetical protein
MILGKLGWGKLFLAARLTRSDKWARNRSELRQEGPFSYEQKNSIIEWSDRIALRMGVANFPPVVRGALSSAYRERLLCLGSFRTRFAGTM